MDPDDEYTFRMREVEMPSAGLEDVLVGVTLKFAKETFMGRDDAGADEFFTLVDNEDEDEDGNGHHVMNDKGVERKLEAGGASGGANMEVGMDANLAEQAVVGNKEGTQGSGESEGDPGQEPSQPQTRVKPVVSADDEKSRELLRPSIRHTLFKLDEVLMALHYARKTCRQYSHSENNTDDEAPALEEPTTPVKRPKGRPRKFANLPDRSRTNGESQAQPMDDVDLFRAKKTHRGRPQKVYEHLEGETQQDYLIRIARIQKKALPAFAPARETPETCETGRNGKSPAKKATSEEREKDRQRRTRPRDWSEVLSSAALVGFSPNVIARATQRCANLFGETMSMRSMVEMPFSEKDDDLLTHYQPQLIPDLGDEEANESSENDDSASASGSGGKRRDRTRNIRLGQAPLKQTCFCPIPDCPRRTRGFNGISKLKKHLQRGHQIPKDGLDEYILPSDEEMDGAVHVDGFLKPLRRMGGTRGIDEKEGKRSRYESDEESYEAEGAQHPEITNQKLPRPAESDDSTGDGPFSAE